MTKEEFIEKFVLEYISGGGDPSTTDYDKLVERAKEAWAAIHSIGGYSWKNTSA